MKTVELVQHPDTKQWAAKLDGEWMRSPKRGVVRWFRTEKAARRAAARPCRTRYNRCTGPDLEVTNERTQFRCMDCCRRAA